MAKVKRILSIAGSDSSGGAGIQADIKTITALGGYAMTAITAVTAQNTQKLTGIYALPSRLVEDQIVQTVQDIGVDAIKIGMIGGQKVLEIVRKCLLDLKKHYRCLPIVIDPVMSSTTGGTLFKIEDMKRYCHSFLSLATVITPNRLEAEKLHGAAIKNFSNAKLAAYDLSNQLGLAVLLKGGHLDEESGECCDILVNQKQVYYYRHKRIATKHTHGTGCTLSSALAFYLAQDIPLTGAVKRAGDYVHGAIKHHPALGHGSGPLWHQWKSE